MITLASPTTSHFLQLISLYVYCHYRISLIVCIIVLHLQYSIVQKKLRLIRNTPSFIVFNSTGQMASTHLETYTIRVSVAAAKSTGPIRRKNLKKQDKNGRRTTPELQSLLVSRTTLYFSGIFRRYVLEVTDHKSNLLSHLVKNL